MGSSYRKLVDIFRICVSYVAVLCSLLCSIGVHVVPKRLYDRVWVVPLLSWYYNGFSDTLVSDEERMICKEMYLCSSR